MEFLPGDWPSSMVPLALEATGLASGPLLCTEEQKYALEGVDVELPYICRTKAPYTAQPKLDVPNGEINANIVFSFHVRRNYVNLCKTARVAFRCLRHITYKLEE